MSQLPNKPQEDLRCVCILDTMVRKDLPDDLKFEQRPEKSEGMTVQVLRGRVF